MKQSLSWLLFECEDIAEAIAITGGGAGMASTGQITGGAQGGRVKRRKKLVGASPDVHDPDALALQGESFGAMHKPDFKGEAMPGLWKGLEDPDEPTKTLLIADDEDKLY